MENTSDKDLNPQLKEQVQGLRGGIVAQAHNRPIPDRFICEGHPDRPAVIITDSETGKQVTVPLFAYGEVRTTLSALFGE